MSILMVDTLANCYTLCVFVIYGDIGFIKFFLYFTDIFIGPPWCTPGMLVTTPAITTTAEPGAFVCPADDDRENCGYAGIDQTGCENGGCAWCPSQTDGK